MRDELGELALQLWGLENERGQLVDFVIGNALFRGVLELAHQHLQVLNIVELLIIWVVLDHQTPQPAHLVITKERV